MKGFIEVPTGADPVLVNISTISKVQVFNGHVSLVLTIQQPNANGPEYVATTLTYAQVKELIEGAQ